MCKYIETPKKRLILLVAWVVMSVMVGKLILLTLVIITLLVIMIECVYLDELIATSGYFNLQQAHEHASGVLESKLEVKILNVINKLSILGMVLYLIYLALVPVYGILN